MIIVSIPVTGLGLYSGYRGDEWFKRRIELFHKYTLQSLLKQTEQDFTIWLQFRPEEKDNPLIKTINIPHKHIMTFHGICIWDDRKHNEEDGLLNRLKDTIPELNIGKEDVKLINLGSDDMYSREVIASVKAHPFEHHSVLTHRLGWVYSENTDQLAEWNPTTHPPFYCLMINNETFTDPQKHFEIIEGIKSHEFVTIEFEERRMPDRRYCVVTHNANISTTYKHPFRGNEIYDEDSKLSILKNFHL